jgi:hypothetical protein
VTAQAAYQIDRCNLDSGVAGAEMTVNSAYDYTANNARLVQPLLWSPVPCRTVNLVD